MARKTLYAAALLSGLLAACGPVNRGLESVKQPVVSRTDYVLDLAGGYDGLAEGEAARLDGWFRSLELGYGDVVYVEDVEPVRRAAIASVASRYGLTVAPGAPVTTGDRPEGAVRVVVSRTDAKVDDCPDWSEPSHPNFTGRTTSNYGCAVNGNHAAMIANPEDLVRGREAGATVDARTATKAVQSYRSAKPTGEQGLTTESSRRAQ